MGEYPVERGNLSSFIYLSDNLIFFLNEIDILLLLMHHLRRVARVLYISYSLLLS